MSNKAFIFLLAISLMVAVITFVLSYFTMANSLLENVLSISFGFFFMMGFILLLNNGTLITTFYWNIILVFLGVVFIGILLKIQHWPHASTTLSVGFGGLFLVYSVFFIRKKEKKRLDIIKGLWVLVTCASALFKSLKFLPSLYISYFDFSSSLLLAAAVVDFSIQEFKQKEEIEE